MKIRLSRWGWGLLLAGWCLSALGADKIALKGVKGALADNIEIYLQSLPVPKRDPGDRERNRITDQIKLAMQALGYFEPKIGLRWDGKAGQLLADIDRGPPTRLGQVTIRIDGEGSDDPVLQGVIANSGVAAGAIFHQGRYESLKSTLVGQALTRGYFDVSLSSHEVRVSLADRSANILLVLDSGPRYRFGELSFEGDTELVYRLDNMRPFDVGDPFQNDKLGEYNNNLSSTGYYKSVVVRPQLELRKDQAVPVQIDLQDKPANIMELGVGYSTDVGVRGKIGWTKPRLNRLGHSFTTSLHLSQPEKTVSATYKIPKRHPLEDFYAIDVGYQQKHREDTESRSLSLTFKRQRPIRSDWSGTQFVRIEREHYRVGTDEQQLLMVVPGISLLRNRNRGGLNPYWGDQQLLTLEASDPSWGSDPRLLKAQLRSKWLRSIDRRHKFIVRGDAGAIATSDIDEVPVSMRFFSGGDQTIRGFGYEKVAPEDEEGNLVGGRYLAVGSLEYSYPIADKWALATFVDSGTVTNDFSEPLRVGTGLGVRWMTPVGPLKVDLAFAVSEPGTPFRLHITMGPEL